MNFVPSCKRARSQPDKKHGLWGRLIIHSGNFSYRFLELNMAFKVFCAILLLIPGVLCRCENPESFKEKDDYNGHRMCAILYNVSCLLNALHS